MRFSTISATLALVLSANAATMSKRAITPDVQTCINDLIATDTQLTVVTNGVNAYTASMGYSGALAVQSQETTLETKLTTAGTSCCKTTTTVSTEDANAVLAEVAIITPHITAALSTIVTKKPVFDSVFLVTPLVKNDVNNLHTKTSKVINCLIAATPADLAATAQGYATTVENAFQAAIAAYK
ncbi:hypothetical protein K501DRAFT_337570 [Backusella circina FSU 941]|nr:hypothetical protein K501DRAFT_337570 [Backusella circina FSU 941]